MARCFIAVPIVATVGVKGLGSFRNTATYCMTTWPAINLTPTVTMTVDCKNFMICLAVLTVSQCNRQTDGQNCFTLERLMQEIMKLWTPRGIVTDDEVVQRRRGGPHLKRTWRTEESIGTASGLWLQTGADGELLLPIVLSRTGGSKC